MEKKRFIYRTKSGKSARSIGDIQEQRKIEFFAELPKLTIDDLYGQNICVEVVRVIPNFGGQFGRKDMLLVKGERCSDKFEFTTVTSHTALMNQFVGLRDGKQLPACGRIIWKEPEQGGNKYYSFEDVEDKLPV